MRTVPLRVAVATDDGALVWRGEFYKAKYFAIFDLTGKSPAKVELRVNTRRNRGSAASALEVLRDCEVIIAGAFDPESRDIVEAKGIIAHETSRESVEEAVLELAETISRLS